MAIQIGGIMLVYIHGFNSSSESDTAKFIKHFHPDLIAVDYSYKNPSVAINQIVKLCTTEERVVIIGSSLGGWFAEKVAQRVVCDLILINPSLTPETNLIKYNIDQEIMWEYEDLKAKDLARCNRFVLIGKDDTVVDPAYAMTVYKNKATVLTVDCGHRLNVMGKSVLISVIDKMSKLVNE
jgi:hypothetical protein